MNSYPDKEAGQVPMACVVRQRHCSLAEAEILDFVAKQVLFFTALFWAKLFFTALIFIHLLFIGEFCIKKFESQLAKVKNIFLFS